MAGGDALTGHDPVTGKELWRWDTWNPQSIPNWPLIASPVASEGLALLCVPKNQPTYAVRGVPPALGQFGRGLEHPRYTGVTSEVPTPACYDGDFFVLSDSRKSLMRLESDTGKVKWIIRTPGTAKYEASPLVGDGRFT